MPPFINRIWLQGKIVTHPSTKALSPQTNVTMFMLSAIESWTNGDGERRERANRIPIEVVGRESARIAAHARVGMWVTVEGYLRCEQYKGQDIFKVRTLSIDLWEETDDQGTETSCG